MSVNFLTDEQNQTYARYPEQLTQEQLDKYLNLNNFLQQDQLQRLIKPTLGFKSRKSAYATIKGFEWHRQVVEIRK